jgi:hypothetical protein
MDIHKGGKLKKSCIVFSAAFGLAMASTASANQFNLLSGLPATQQTLGTSQVLTFTDDYGSGNVTAYGYTANNGSLTQLYDKVGGADETGLGMLHDSVNSGDHEIAGAAFIQLDFTALLAQYSANPYKLVSAQIGLGSVQSSEGYKIYGSTTQGAEGTTLLGSGGSDGVVTISLAQLQADHFISIVAPTGDILIDSAVGVSAATPEPATNLLMGGGLLAAAFLFRRSRKAISRA